MGWIWILLGTAIMQLGHATLPTVLMGAAYFLAGAMFVAADHLKDQQE